MSNTSHQAAWSVAAMNSLAAVPTNTPSSVARQLAQSLATAHWHDSVWSAYPWFICSRNSQGRSRRPITMTHAQETNRSQRVPWHFSISHGETYVAVACSDSRRIGIDVVDCFHGSPTSLHWAMTPTEIEWLHASDANAHQLSLSTRTLMLWSAKEAAFKASRARRFQPQQIQIDNLQHQPSTRVGSVHLAIHWDLLNDCIVARASQRHTIWHRKFISTCSQNAA